MAARRFDGLEVGLIAVLAAALAATLLMSLTASRRIVVYKNTYAAFETEAFYQAQFGTQSRYSADAEEYLIRDFFGDRRDGVFVDVGASHYRQASNTYFLESVLGWSGLAIDAQAEYAADYATHRPRTRYLTAFVSDQDDELAQLFVPPPGKNLGIASGSERFVTDATGVGEVRRIPTVTLNRALAGAGIERFDFLSLDIELYEPKALAGFDIGRHQPSLVCVEAHLPVRQALLDYFADSGYVVVGKYMRVDANNLYFMRRDRTFEPEIPVAARSHRPPHN